VFYKDFYYYSSRRVRMMNKFFSNVLGRRWARIALLAGFCFVLYFSNIDRWDLWSPDEPRYAQVAKEMVTGGDWILMHYNGRVYSDKPPLFFWLIGLSSYLWQDFSSISVRFSPALFGSLTVLLTFLLGSRLYASRAGLLSGFILATGGEFAYLSTRANIDTTLTFFTTASLFCFFKWYQQIKEEEEKVKVTEKKTNWTIYGFYGGMGLATLTKGPVGFLLPLLTSVIYLVTQRDWKTIRKMKVLPGMVLFIVIVLAWYLPAVWKGGESYLRETLLTHSLDRYAIGWAKVRPIYYYLYTFPSSFLPWVIFLPSAIVYSWSKEMVKKRKESYFLTVWFAVVFLFFSLSKGKRSLYLLPLFPAVSLMIGTLWDNFISDPAGTFKKRWVSLPLSGLAGLLLLLGVAIVLSSWLHGSIWDKIPDDIFYRLPIISMGMLLVACSLLLFGFVGWRSHRTVFIVLIAIMAGGFFYTCRVVFPLVNPHKSARFLSQEITSRMRPGDKVGVYGRVSAAPHNYYTGVVPILDLNRAEDLFDFLRSSDRVFCLLTFREFYGLQASDGRPELHLLARRQVGELDTVLISNR
jgi:4-amino-4-deoxy-L-arabinose transferase-like glycosyltransferase